MKIFVGSTNPVKTNAVTLAAVEQWPEVEVFGYEVASGVNEQPMSDAETKQGAINRAKKVFNLGLASLTQKPTDKISVLGIGLEGGVFVDNEDQMWTTVWAAVIDQSGEIFLANGARFKVAKIVADDIIRGQEMGPIISNYFNGRSVKTQEGLIGIVTNNFVDRTEEYSAIAKMAIGLWYGRNWQEKLQQQGKL